MEAGLLTLFTLLLASGNCVKKSGSNFTVSNSRLASLEDFRHQVLIKVYDGDYGVCGGSIIDNRHVLTAGHCVTYDGSCKKLPANSITIIAGTENREDPKAQKYSVIKIFLHKKYKTSPMKHDIALLRINMDFAFNPSVLPIQLTDKPTRPDQGIRCVISGWGFTEKETAVQETLKYTNVDIVDDLICSEKYKGYFQKGMMICAHDLKGDACSGDSGGPLTCNGQLVGVISGGSACGDGSPGVYTDVYHYKSWIDSTIQKPSEGRPFLPLKMPWAKKATLLQFPYKVVLLLESGQICGGTILNNRTIITAAHCMIACDKETISRQQIRILAGLIDMGEGGAQEYEVEKILIHPQYNKSTFRNDIALLKVKQSFIFSSRVKNISLRSTPLSPTGEDGCMVSGWGNTDQTEILQDDLMFINVKILKQEACSTFYGDELDNDEFCVQDEAGNLDACSGDCGGSLICSNELVGIMAKGIFCDKQGYPGLYTNVYNHKEWIEEQLNSSKYRSCQPKCIIFGLIFLIFTYLLLK